MQIQIQWLLQSVREQANRALAMVLHTSTGFPKTMTHESWQSQNQVTSKQELVQAEQDTRITDQFDNVVGRLHLLGGGPGLSMQAHPYLHLILPQPAYTQTFCIVLRKKRKESLRRMAS